jgi:hypothetical protein
MAAMSSMFWLPYALPRSPIQSHLIPISRRVVDDAMTTLRRLPNRITLALRPLISANLEHDLGESLATRSLAELQNLISVQSNAIKLLQEELHDTEIMLAGEMDRREKMIEDWIEKAGIQHPLDLPTNTTPRIFPSQYESAPRRARRSSWVSIESDGISNASSWEEIGGDNGDVLMMRDLEFE